MLKNKIINYLLIINFNEKKYFINIYLTLLPLLFTACGFKIVDRYKNQTIFLYQKIKTITGDKRVAYYKVRNMNFHAYFKHSRR